MIETATFTCSICNEPSTEICAYCTKDVCSNHRCERCKRCSDCCECDVPLTPPERKTAETAAAEQVVPEAPLSVQEPNGAASPGPPEATEEPDLNTLPAAVIENVVEQEQHQEEARPSPAGSASETPDGSD